MLTSQAQFHKLPPSCVLALPRGKRANAGCTCEEVRHEEDWVKIKPKLSYGEKLELSEKMGQSPAYGLCWMLERFIVEWSLKDTSARLVNPIEGAKGDDLPISVSVMYDLDEETADYLTELTDRSPTASGESEAEGPKAKRSARRSRSS